MRTSSRPKFWLILLFGLISCFQDISFAQAQSDSSSQSLVTSLIIPPIQITIGAGAYAAFYLTFSKNMDPFYEDSTHTGSIGRGLGQLSAVALTGAVVHISGDLLFGQERGYIGVTILGGLVGVIPWNIMPSDAGNWRVLNYALPPACWATFTYFLQRALIPQNRIRISPYVDGVTSGMKLRYIL
jgi:hypothetical protein